MSWLFDREVAQLSVLQEGEGSGAFRLRHPALTLARNLVALEHAYGFPPTREGPADEAEGTGQGTCR